MYEFDGYLVEEGKLLTKFGCFAYDEESKILYFKKQNTLSTLLGGGAGAVGVLLGHAVNKTMDKFKNAISYNLETLEKIELFRCRLNKAIKLISKDFTLQIIPSNIKETSSFFSNLIDNKN